MRRIEMNDDLDLFFQIFDTLANPIFVKNEEHRFIMVNDAFCRLFRVAKDDFVGKTDAELFPEKEWKIFREKDTKILSTGLPDENEEDATIPGGNRLRVLTQKSLLRSRSGRKFVLGVITDITEKATLMEKIMLSEEKYKSIFNLGSDPAGLFLYPERIAVEVNDAFLRIGGVTRKHVIGKAAPSAFSWVDPGEREKYFRTLEAKKAVRNMEIRLRNHKGKIIPFLASANLFRIRDQQYVLYSMRDISELKKAETALRESEHMYREMVDFSPVPLFIHRDGTIMFVNDAAIRFVGVPKAGILGKSIGEIIRIPGIRGNKKSLTALFQEPSQAWEAKDIIMETTERIPRHFLFRNVRITYSGGEAIMSKILDITERSKIEKYFINKILEAEENERARFAADLHDDLGPTLSTMRHHLEILQKNKDPKKVMQGLKAFDCLLDEVLKKVHMISHSISPHMIGDFGLESALGDFIERINTDRRYRIRFSHNIENLRFPREIELHLYRIILELINNTMKHSRTRDICIELNYRKGFLTLRYHDEGEGYRVKEILKNSKGIGIPNIINRAGLINGDIGFLRVKGKTLVTVRAAIGMENVKMTAHPV